jgi:hypothetical protein
MKTNSSFFVCKDYFLLFYETREDALAATAADSGRCGSTSWSRAAAAEANYWSKELNSRVTFSNPGEPIFVIRKDEEYWNVIIGERIGWIIVKDWLEIKPLAMP